MLNKSYKKSEKFSFSIKCRQIFYLICQNQIFINFNSFILVLQSNSSHSTLNRVNVKNNFCPQNLARQKQKVPGGCLCREKYFQSITILVSVLFVLYREALVVYR